MECCTTLLNFFVILTTVLIATPGEASGFRIQSYDESPSYPWERIVYQEDKRLQKKQLDAGGRPIDDLNTTAYIIAESNPSLEEDLRRILKRDRKGNTRMDFVKNMSEMKNYGKAGNRILYDRGVSLPIIVISSYRKPNQ